MLGSQEHTEHSTQLHRQGTQHSVWPMEGTCKSQSLEWSFCHICQLSVLTHANLFNIHLENVGTMALKGDMTYPGSQSKYMVWPGQKPSLRPHGLNLHHCALNCQSFHPFILGVLLLYLNRPEWGLCGSVSIHQAPFCTATMLGSLQESL